MKPLSATLALALSTFIQAENLPNSIEEVVPLLGSESYETRQKSSQKLLELAKADPKKHAKTLAKFYYTNKNPEVRSRLKTTLNDLYNEKFVPEAPGYLGVMHEVNQVELKGAKQASILVLRVVAGTAAQKAGLQAGDNILAIDELDLAKIPAHQVRDRFSRQIKQAKANTVIKIKILRKQKVVEISAKLGAYTQPYQSAPQRDDAFGQWLDDQKP